MLEGVFLQDIRETLWLLRDGIVYCHQIQNLLGVQILQVIPDDVDLQLPLMHLISLIELAVPK